MLQEYDFYRDTSTLIRAVARSLIANQPLTQADVSDVRFTIFEQESPLSNTGTPVPYFEEVILEKTKVLFDSVRDGFQEDKYGVKPIQFNFAHILAPVLVIVNGVEEKHFPFPNIGKCYKVLYSFKSANPDIPDFAIQVVGYAV